MGNSMAVRSLGILVTVCVLGRFRGVIAVTPIPNDEFRREARKWCGADDAIFRNDDYGSISNWNTSLVTDMSVAFLARRGATVVDYNNGTRKTYYGNPACAGFNADISKWDTSGVISMAQMFLDSDLFADSQAFNGDISKWDTSKVNTFQGMFENLQAFNGDISKWDTSKATDFDSMFAGAPAFNGDISKWDTSKATNFEYMFAGARAFNGDISKWDTSKATNFTSMFAGAPFNGDISKWNMSKAQDFKYMFAGAPFNGDISKWDTSKGFYFEYMFAGTPFNGDISKWNTLRGYHFNGMFAGAQAFNGDISKWDTSKAQDFDSMFAGARAFNVDISKWDTSRVENFDDMFEGNNKFNMNFTAFWDTSKRSLDDQPCPTGLSIKSNLKLIRGTVATRCEGYKNTACESRDADCGQGMCISGYINDQGQAINSKNPAKVTCVCYSFYSGDRCTYDQDSTAGGNGAGFMTVSVAAMVGGAIASLS